jgi:hypothetical protein
VAKAHADLTNIIVEWLRRLAADHDGAALIVAKTVGLLMMGDGHDRWFKLRRIAGLTGQAPEVVAGNLHRLRGRGRLHFERRVHPAGTTAEGTDAP